jgi:hypothetical protein
MPISSTFVLQLQIGGVQRSQPNLKPIQTWKEVLSKRVPILGEGIACDQDPDSLHCKALKRAKSLGELKIKSLAIIIRLILILTQFFRNCGIVGISFSFSASQTAKLRHNGE